MTSRRGSHAAAAQPISEQDLVKALTEHAHKIATSILTRPGTGQDLVNDAQVCMIYWVMYNTFINNIVYSVHCKIFFFNDMNIRFIS